MTDNDAHGQLETVDGQFHVRFVRTLPHPPAKVWRAITEDEHLEKWFPTTIEGERRAGAGLTFSFREHHLPSFEGRMVVFEPPTRLELDWGPDRLRFELAPDGDGTRLTLTDIIDPSEQGKAARDAAGWHTKLDELAFDLDHHGDGTPSPFGDDDWSAVHEHYVAAFPAAATTIGPPPEHQHLVEKKGTGTA